MSNKDKVEKAIQSMFGSPISEIDKLIEQAKELKKNKNKTSNPNQPKKRFDKGGSNMAKKNFSSKELIMKATQPKKSKKKLADVSKEDMIKAGFSSFGKESLRKYLNMKNKLGRKPTKADFKSKNFSSKKLITEKSVKSGIPKKNTNFSSKSLITKKSIQSGVPKTKKKVLTQNPFKNPNPPVVATKQKNTKVAQNPFKNPNPKMNKGGVFKGIF